MPAAPLVGEVTTRPPAAFSSFTAIAYAFTQSNMCNGDFSPCSFRFLNSFGARRKTAIFPGNTPSVLNPRATQSRIAIGSGGLFGTIAFRKAEDASGEYKAPTVAEVETFSGQVTDLYLIPQEAGTYDLVCEIEGHFEAGMFGKIIVDS